MVGSANEVVSALGISSAAALAFLMFNLFTPPCFAAIGAMRAEIHSRKWFWSGIGLQFAVGYTVSFLVYFFGSLITGEGFVKAWMPIVGFAIMLFLAALLTILILKRNRSVRIEAEKKANKIKVAV